ncbi:hypothetical protein ACKWRH_20820 [Bradyrhizobium sp. Pa8]|uniref:hypothetical protein n=1 Tax=Bradyrhizobium sp. Pa8 TaxID=3386552 RepID=UPI00403F0231
MTLITEDEGKNEFTKVAFADVFFPDVLMTFYGVRLTHSAKGWRALPPYALTRGSTTPAVRWYPGSPLAESARDALLAMYVKMGGRSPEAVANDGAARRRIAARKAREALPHRTVEQIDADMALGEMGLSRPDTAGLARTLGLAT